MAIDWAVSNFAHPEKQQKGGEDTWYIVENEKESSVGVFDGVGGWLDYGVDPRKWALVMADEVEKSVLPFQGLITTLEKAYDSASQMGIEGSCTACLVYHQNEINSVKYANLGDSGFAVYREGQVIFETFEQTHGFNFPYQLSSDKADLPSDADRGTIGVKKGDVIVVASDGLWDNLYHVEIAKIVDNHYDVGVVAQNLSISAMEASFDPKRWSPFAQKAVEEIYAGRNPDDVTWEPEAAPLTKYLGGKTDDITVIVGRVY